MPAQVTCGVDFDNTIVTYDESLAAIARERGLIGDATGWSKKKIRDAIRRLPDGEIEWQKCQALLYGPRIGEARLIDGVRRFFELCRERGVRICVVSHKTENLRQPASAWIAAHDLGIGPADLWFAATRREKIGRIAALGCTHFIDDLEEVFLEEAFPPATIRILYEPGRESAPPPGVTLMRSWQEIHAYFF